MWVFSHTDSHAPSRYRIPNRRPNCTTNVDLRATDRHGYHRADSYSDNRADSYGDSAAYFHTNARPGHGGCCHC